MREFKFRYKIKGSEKLLYDTGPEFARITQHGVIATSNGGMVFAEKRMQYTGLKDSNDIDIYERGISYGFTTRVLAHLGTLAWLNGSMASHHFRSPWRRLFLCCLGLP